MCATLYVYDLFSFVCVRVEKKTERTKGTENFGDVFVISLSA